MSATLRRVMAERPQISRRSLTNGLRIVFAPNHAVPVVGVSVTYAVGSANEVAGRTGLAHLFEHMMFQGSANVAKSEHVTAIEATGGDADANTGWDTTTYIDVVPSHQLPLVVWLEAERMASLSQAISQDTLDNQREVVKNERQGDIDNVPYGDAEDRLFGLAFPSDHPYAHSLHGSDADLDAATLPEVRDFFTTHYLPNNAVLTVVGDFDPDEATGLVDRYFAPIPAGPAPNPVRPFPVAAPSVRRAEVRDDVPAPKLYLGCLIEPFGTDGWATADFTADLLTSGAASRLQRRLVRELRLADDVVAAAYPLAAGNALLEIDVEASEEANPEEVEAALAAELNRLTAEPPEEAELTRICLRRETDRAVAMQEAGERADRIGNYAALLDEPERFGQEAARDRAITPDAIAALAAGPLSEPNRISLWYLPSDE